MGLQIKKWPSWHPLKTQCLFCCSWWLIKCWDWLLGNVYTSRKMVNNVHFYYHCYTKKVECAPYRCQIGFLKQQFLGNNHSQIVFSFYQSRFWAQSAIYTKLYMVYIKFSCMKRMNQSIGLILCFLYFNFYVMIVGDFMFMLIIYVDNMMIIGNFIQHIELLQQQLYEQFTMSLCLYTLTLISFTFSMVWCHPTIDIF
jgi:hypothetical protein